MRNNLKGRIAEDVVEELFTQLNFKVYRFGAERVLSGLLNRENRFEGDKDTAKRISEMPDFIITKDNHVYFIEVKYRGDAATNFRPPSDYAYPEAFIVVLSTLYPDYIKIQRAQKLLEGKDFVQLDEIEELDIAKNDVHQCIHIFKQTFGFFNGSE
jgi:hypothetical protein